METTLIVLLAISILFDIEAVVRHYRMKHQTPSTTPRVFITEGTIDRETVKEYLAKINIENGGQNRFSKEDGE
jgi:hypothetical protein